MSALVLAGLTTSSHAALIRLEVSGVVDEIILGEDLLQGQVALGARFTGVYLYETEVSLSSVEPGSRVYLGSVQSFSGQVGNLLMSTGDAGPGPGIVQVWDDRTIGLTDLFSLNANTDTTGISGPSMGRSGIVTTFIDFSGNAWDSFEVPTTLSASDFDSIGFRFSQGAGDTTPPVWGN